MASTISSISEPHTQPSSAAGSEAPSSVRRTDRLRVLLVTVGLGVGGTEEQIKKLALRLDPLRYEVLVCALKGDGVVAHELRTRGVRVVTLGGGSTQDIRVLFRLWRLIRRERPHIVHTFLFWANIAARLVGRLLSVPVLISSYRGLGKTMTWSHRLLDRLTVWPSHNATCCSDAVRQTVTARIAWRPERLVTIHNGVDRIRFDAIVQLAPHSRRVQAHDLGLRGDGPVVGTVGRLVEPEKGFSILLQAMAWLQAAPEGPPCQLLIVGEGPAESRLCALCNELGLTDHVVFAGLRRDVAALLPCMDVFVMPSLSEGFGIAIVEAMMARRPVVATSVGGIPEVVVPGETGLLVPPGDPIALAEAIRDLLRQPDMAARMGRMGRQRAEANFSVETMVARHQAFYESLAAEAGVRAASHTRG